MEKNFTEVVKYLAGLGWPFRQHATFDATARAPCSTCWRR